MNFKTFLEYSPNTSTGERRSITHNVNAGYDILRNKCSTNWSRVIENLENRKSIVYRGVYDNFGKTQPITESPFLDVDPKQSIRKSRNTENIYTLIIDNSSKWQEYPKRSQSIVCAFQKIDFDPKFPKSNTFIDTAYGSGFIVVPYDSENRNFGICDASDLWGSFPFIKTKRLPSIADFNTAISYLLKRYIDPATVRTAETSFEPTLLFNLFKEFDKLFNTKINNIQTQPNDVSFIPAKFLDDMKTNYHGNLLNYCEYLLDPQSNKFKATTFGDLMSLTEFHDERTREVWTDNHCLLVNPSILKNEF